MSEDPKVHPSVLNTRLSVLAVSLVRAGLVCAEGSLLGDPAVLAVVLAHLEADIHVELIDVLAASFSWISSFISPVRTPLASNVEHFLQSVAPCDLRLVFVTHRGTRDQPVQSVPLILREHAEHPSAAFLDPDSFAVVRLSDFSFYRLFVGSVQLRGRSSQ